MLEDGSKTTREILLEVPCIVHSRVAELRKRGHAIVCERIEGEGAGAYRYTLLREGEPAHAAGDSPSRSRVHPDDYVAPLSPAGSGHVDDERVSGVAAASSDPAPCLFDVVELEEEQERLEYMLAKPPRLDSPNYQQSRAIWERQLGEINEKLERSAA
jgi:hypothetical protein